MELHGWRRISYCGGLGLTVGAVVLTSTMILRAQGRGGGAPAGPALVPMAASSLSLHPELYLGQTVAVTANVEKSLTATTFTVDQGKARTVLATAQPKPVLVIAQNLNAAVPVGSYVTVVGKAVKFDPATIGNEIKGYKLDLPADVAEKYKGQPVLIATSVLNASMTDLAKKAIPPMTPAELEFQKVMKGVSPAFTAIRQSADASDKAATTAKTAELRKYFADTEAFFKTRNAADAVGWAAEAQKLVTTMEADATAGKWDAVKAGATAVNGLCQSCHTARRERLDDGTFRVK